MKYLLLPVLLLQLYGTTVAATVSSSTPARYRGSRRRSGRVRGSSNRRQLTTHSNIFNTDETDPLHRIQQNTFLGEAGLAGLTAKARGKTKTKDQAEAKQAEKSSKKGSKDSSESSDDESQLSIKEPKGGVLNLAAKTSTLKKKMGKGSKGSDASDSKDSSSSKGKGSGKATEIDTGQAPSSDVKLSLSLKSQKGDKMPKGYPSTSSPKYNGTPSQSPKGAGSKVKTPSPTRYRTPSPTRRPISRSKSGGKGMGGMGMGSGKMTEAPVQMPVLPPSPISCTVNSAGNTGSMRGDATLYDFFYQLELVPGLSVEEINDTLLKEIEIVMADALIPDLFPNQCGRRRKRRRLQDAGSYVGLSTRPPDFVLNGFSCTGDPSEPCYIASGATTVYSEGLSPDTIQQDLSTGIQNILMSGLLTETFDDIVSTTLLDSNLNPATLAPTTIQQPTATVAPTIAPATTPPVDVPESAAPTIQAVAPVTASPIKPSETLIPTSAQETSAPTDPVPTISPTVSNSPTSSHTPSISPMPTRAPTVPTPFPTRPPSSSPSNDDDGPPFFPLWAWITLAVGVAILFLICFYLNMSSRVKPLDGEGEKLKHSRFESKAFSDDGDSYVPPGEGLGGSATAPNRYMQANALKTGAFSDSEESGAGEESPFVPPNISLDPNAEGSMMNNPTNVIYEEDDEGEEESSEEAESGEEEEEEEDEEYEEEEDEDEDEEGGEYGEYYEGDEDEDEDQDGDEDVDNEEETGTILGEFQVVAVDAKSGNQGYSQSGDDTGDEESGSEYDEESYVEEDDQEEDSYDEESYIEEEDMDEEELDDEEEEEEGEEGEQSWLDELQQAQAGQYPGWSNKSL